MTRKEQEKELLALKRKQAKMLKEQKKQIQLYEKQKKKSKKLRIGLGIGLPVIGVVGFILGWWIPQINPFNPIDKSLLDKINSLLKQSKWCNTMDQTVDLLYDNNIDILSVYPSDADQEYVWDQDVNQYVIIDGKTGQAKCWSRGYKLNTKKNRLWKMVNAGSFKINNEYAQYLRTDDYSSHLTDDGYMQFVSGVDAGLNKAINFEYKGGANSSFNATEDPNDTPVVNTNYGHLRINGPLNSVRHYGIAQTLTVTKLDHTYYERGIIIGDVIVLEGSFIADEGSDINTIVVAGDDATVEVKKGADVGSYGALGDESRLENVTIDTDVPEKDKPTNVGVLETPEDDEPYLHGLGTQESPYILSSREDFDLLIDYYDETKFQYFKFDGADNHIDCSGWAAKHHECRLLGELDGNGVILENLDCYLFKSVGAPNEDELSNTPSVIKNMTINNVCIDAMEAIGVVAKTVGNVTRFENIDVHGYAMGTMVGGFVGFGATNFFSDSGPSHNTYTKVTFKNCINDCNLIAATEVGAWMDHTMVYNPKQNDTYIKLEDSIFLGHISGKSGGTGRNDARINYFYTETTWDACIPIKTKYSPEFIQQYGNPEGVQYGIPVNPIIDEDGFKSFKSWGCWSYRGETQDYYYPQETPETGSIHKNYLTIVENDTWLPGDDVETVSTTKKENATKILVWLEIAPDKFDSGTYNTTYLTETINVSEFDVGATISSNIVKKYKIRVNPEGQTETGVHGEYFDIVDPQYSTTFSAAFIGMIQLDENNNGFHIEKYNYQIPK